MLNLQWQICCFLQLGCIVVRFQPRSQGYMIIIQAWLCILTSLFKCQWPYEEGSGFTRGLALGNTEQEQHRHQDRKATAQLKREW